MLFLYMKDCTELLTRWLKEVYLSKGIRDLITRAVWATRREEGVKSVLPRVKLICEFWRPTDVSHDSTTPNLLRATAGCTTYKIPKSPSAL